MSAISHVEIVIPARNEHQHLGACIRSLSTAVDHVSAAQPAVSCGITVVLDCCTDDSADLLAPYSIHILDVEAGCVGTARRSGVADAIERAGRAGHDPQRLWIANTDADTVVASTWLQAQLRFAHDGVDAVFGTVIPFGVSPAVYRRWRARYQLTENHPHVHGANLGFRASTYLDAGGFADLPTGVARIRDVTTGWVAASQTSVRTSGLWHSRVHGGFASYVAALEAP